MRKVGGKETKRHVLVDGNNLIYRAYYVNVENRINSRLPLMSSPDGYPTGVIYGSLDMLANWLYSIPDITKISVFFDGHSKRRKELDPTYKSNRTGGPGLKLQTTHTSQNQLERTLRDGYLATGEVDILAHLLGLLGCDVYHHPEEEADDLIASFCKLNPDSIRFIVSSDKDFFQLLSDPRIICYVPGLDGDRFFDTEKSTKYWTKFNKGNHPAVPPTHVRMFKALCGDTSDAVKGIERLRKKVAVPLCHHTSVDELYATGLPGFSDSEKEKATIMLEKIRVNYELVGLNSSVDTSTCLRPLEKNYGMGNLILQDLGINSIDMNAFRDTPVQVPRQENPPGIPTESWLLDI